MKTLLSLCICVLTLSISFSAQTPETYDIATFRSPRGWNKQAGQNSVLFSTEDKAKGSYCLVNLFKSLPALGDPKENFEAAWKTLVQEAVTVSSAPQMFPSDNKEDWKVEGGYAPFTKDGEKGVVVLYTASGYGKMVNILVLTNTMDYEPTITAFLESFSFKKLEAAAPQATAGDRSGGESIVGVWGAASSNQSSYAVNNGLSGYIKKQYTFSPNGTYEFLVKTFQSTMRNLLFTKETGTYQINGNSLTLIPQKGYIQAWTKGIVIESSGKQSETDNWGKLVSTQPTKLEKATYQVSKEYFSGIQEWNLVMRAAAPTERDGPFTGNSNFPNSWLYKPQQYPIKPPQ